MSLKNIYTEDVQYVSPETKLSEVAKLMETHDCGSILVAQNDKLTGVITDRDIVIRCVSQSKDPSSMMADDCKTSEVLYCFADDDPEEVLDNMAQNKVKRLPVLNNDQDKRLVGIVSFGDLSAACDHKEVSGKAMDEIRRAA